MKAGGKIHVQPRVIAEIAQAQMGEVHGGSLNQIVRYLNR
jgi:hypothetical protein